LHYRRTENGIVALGLLFSLMFLIVIAKYFTLASDRRYSAAALQKGTIKVEVESGEGFIFDRNMKPLVNTENKYTAVAVPSMLNRDETAEFAVDKDYFFTKYDEGLPFSFECIPTTKEQNGLTVFRVPVRYSENQSALHVIGYTSQGKGVSGIEYAYDRILRSEYAENSVTYSTDGFGNVLIGEEFSVNRSGNIESGVVTTLDSEIQKICEDSGGNIDRGAILAAEIKTGDILAMATYPDYSVYDLEAALNDARSPMINRNLYSYSVGSIFKLVTACEAINQKMEGYRGECTGCTDVSGRNFNCHKLDGHGVQDMKRAMVNSCNTYFINLSRNMSLADFRETAYNLGFGREIHLCSGITSSGGILPDAEELEVPAELANFSFGQGKLTASPLQILQLTCAIGNEGKMPVPRLIKGLSEDGKNVVNEKKPQYAYVMKEKTADLLRQMMTAAIEENDESKAKPLYTSAGAKTSTAQTGKFNEKGAEEYNAWITGFFPADNPEYAVTVLVENGGYGNDSAAPIFKEIADKITKLREKD